MMKRICLLTSIFCGLVATSSMVFAAESTVPEPFQRFNTDSRYSINYADLNTVFKRLVVNTGRSNREKAEPVQAKTGTRMKPNVKRYTVNEGNRFYYEVFTNDENATQYLLGIQENLEALPTEAPLEYFSRDEQLAYWLNLYNVTLINEVIKVYPERKLKKLLTGKKSILKKKLLNVAGVPLSLDDIQYTILKQNYDNNPLIIYGLYQGNIGGPNIRKSAYTAANVQRNLANNASDFINSNRGTYSKTKSVFRASSLYERNREYFPDFQTDLKKHLLVYLEGVEKGELQASTVIKPDIQDWTVTDLFGSYPELGGSLADNSAAMLGSVSSVNAGDGAATAGPGAGNMDRVQSKASVTSYVSPELIAYLHEIKANQDFLNQQQGTVTVEEMGEVPTDDEESAPNQDEKD
jgi:hypothetical protein